MDANRYGDDRHLKPGSLAVALALNGGVLAAVLLAPSETVTRTIEHVLQTTNIEIVPPPPPLDPPKLVRKAAPQPDPRPTSPARIVRTEMPPTELTPAGPSEVVVGRGAGAGGGTGVVIDPPAPPPVFVDPVIDRRFRGAFQPDYPAAERREGREGSVVLRVLIGTDGRVIRAERISATSDAFYTATLRTALARWRFRPGTRGGVAIERWRTMTVTFRIEEA